MSTGVIRVGLPTWTYEPWRGSFYPKTVTRAGELGYAATQFRLLELNSTYHGQQYPEAFRAWAEQVPAEFVFAIRGPRLITHTLRLQNCEVPLANFIASGLLRLGLHLGPIVWQLPANLRFEPEEIEAFLQLLPRSTDSAIILGRKHNHLLRGPPWLSAEALRPIRHAIQVQHHTFHCLGFIELLRAYDVALVCTDLAVGEPPLADATSDFVYCRLYEAGHDSPLGQECPDLNQWISRFRAWAGGGEPEDCLRIGGKARPRRRDVFVVLDSNLKIRAPVLAQEITRRLRT